MYLVDVLPLVFVLEMVSNKYQFNIAGEDVGVEGATQSGFLFRGVLICTPLELKGKEL